jgi:hypothetical protein
VSRPRLFATCKRCSFEREHYTRADGTKVSPCVMCSRELAAKREEAKAADPDHAAKRREVYRRYNNSEKGRARLHKHRAGEGDDKAADASSLDRERSTG